VDHASRRRRLADRFDELGLDAVLVTRAPNVRYLTGFSGSNGQLLTTSDAGFFFTDSRYDEQSRREVPDLRRVIYPRKFAPSFAEACREAGLARVGFEASGLTFRAWRELGDVDAADLVALDEEEVERLRWAKDAEELRLIERAQEVTDAAFDRVIGKLAEGVTERQAGFELDLAMRELGAEQIGFDTIVAFGESAAEPHHRPLDRELRRGDVVKIDFGCVIEGYHSDMTRTVAFGEPDARLREVYEVVLRAQLTGIEAVRAGVTGADADEAARTVIRDAGHGERFGHSLGHGVGLEIHEGPSLRSGSEDVLPRGAVVTVEPGAYIPGLGGVRIEDMVVVEDGGCRPLPRTPKDLLVL
jgi:Xaa-Pro aminopeptidase